MKTGTIKKVCLYVGLVVIGMCMGMLMMGFKSSDKLTSTDTGYEVACIERFNLIEDQNYVLNKNCKVVVYEEREFTISEDNAYTRVAAVIYNMNDERIGEASIRADLE